MYRCSIPFVAEYYSTEWLDCILFTICQLMGTWVVFHLGLL